MMTRTSVLQDPFIRARWCANSMNLEALGNKASSRERSRGDSRARCFAQDSAGMDGLKRKNNQGRDPRTQERKEQPQWEREDIQLVRRASPTASSQRTISIRIEALQTQITQQDDRRADDSDSAQRSEAKQSQFIKETIEIPVSAHRQTEFRKSWKILNYSAMMKRSNNSPQCLADCGELQVKSTGKRVDDTEIMRTSSGNPSSTVNSENASDSVQTDAEHQEDPEAH